MKGWSWTRARTVWLIGAVLTVAGLVPFVTAGGRELLLVFAGLSFNDPLTYWSLGQTVGLLGSTVGLVVAAAAGGWSAGRRAPSSREGRMGAVCVSAAIAAPLAVLAVLVPSGGLVRVGPIDWTTVVLGVGPLRLVGLAVLMIAGPAMAAALATLLAGTVARPETTPN